MSTKYREFIIAATTLIFAAMMWWWLIPAYVGTGDEAILPRLIAAVIGISSISMLVLNLWSTKEATDADDDPFLEIGGGEAPRVILIAVVWGVFCFTLNTIGFYLGGGLALAATYLLLRVRPLWTIGLWTAGVLLFVYLVFSRGFQLHLPPGALFSQLFVGIL